MPYKDDKQQKQYQKEWYKKEKYAHVERNKSNRQKRRNVVNAYKLESGCNRCGYNKCSSALEAHHVGGDKTKDISEMVLGCASINRIEEELNKCEILCANCHRELHDENKTAGLNKKLGSIV